MSFQGLKWGLSTKFPLCIVTSSSMSPVLNKGDIILVSNHSHQQYNIGDIVVFKLESQSHPIVHRITSIVRPQRPHGIKLESRLFEQGLNAKTGGKTIWKKDQLRVNKYGSLPWSNNMKRVPEVNNIPSHRWDASHSLHKSRRRQAISHRGFHLRTTEGHSSNFVTRGDQNRLDDRLLYAKDGITYLTRDRILGKVLWSVPYLGHLKRVLSSLIGL
ncbi:uncharacterized protein LOC131881835 isoform X2 [Tigriopus californicus]|uniref:uncharacterized protein LOC131881835 isoform X2 n=1 Tax=Tigriopus californicus TaxID=6832 RepID=UPI0027DA84DA|nr:uncharacterized protein LOC131881835 isoform X2 [Tigriopus californicus]